MSRELPHTTIDTRALHAALEELDSHVSGLEAAIDRVKTALRRAQSIVALARLTRRATSLPEDRCGGDCSRGGDGPACRKPGCRG